MALPDTDVKRVRRWVEAQNEAMPPAAAEVVRLEVDVGPRAITIVECRPLWDDPSDPEWIRQEVVRLRYTASRQVWSLYWPDSNSKFHLYDLIRPTTNVERLLVEIDADPTCIFWG